MPVAILAHWRTLQARSLATTIALFGRVKGKPIPRMLGRALTVSYSEQRRLTTAPLALQRHSLAPLSLLPKEGLALVNGTAPSCSVAACALHDSHFLLLLSQATTALCVEALLGTSESFLPFVSDVARPHPGQIEVARNIRNAIHGSTLVRAYDERRASERLRQDRYSLRTAPQWLGPQVEELKSAHDTLNIEINATTDNPMIDRSRGVKGSVHGGNFQGTSLTVAMEKIRIGLQHVGKRYAASTRQPR